MAGFPTPNILDPTQQRGREKRAYADFRRRLRAINAEIQERVVDRLQPREIAVNGLRAYLLNAEKVYIYELDYLQLRRINETIAEIIQRIMMQRGEHMPPPAGMPRQCKPGTIHPIAHHAAS